MSNNIVVVQLEHSYYVFCKENYEEIYFSTDELSKCGKFIPRDEFFDQDVNDEDVNKIKEIVAHIARIENRKMNNKFTAVIMILAYLLVLILFFAF